MKQPTIAVRVHIPIDQLESLICSMATGSSYWCAGVDKLGYDSAIHSLLSNGTIKLKDYEDGERSYILDYKKIKKGLGVMAKHEPYHFSNILKEEADQDTSDILLQCALFGEVLYS